jgi:hypothetical protein
MRAETHVGPYAKCQLLILDFNKEFKYVDKLQNIEFHENLFSSSRVVMWEQVDGQTDLAKPIGAFWQLFVLNPPKWKTLYQHCCLMK